MPTYFVFSIEYTFQPSIQDKALLGNPRRLILLLGRSAR